MARKLGQLEAAAIAYVQMRKQRTVRTGDLVSPLSITPKKERELLSRMARSGLIANVRRGLYLFPERLPLGGSWTPDETTAINVLMSDKRASYQITGPNAFNYWGYDGQIPARIYLYNTAISGNRRIGKIELALIKVSDARLGGTEKVRNSYGETTIYSSRIRTLVDAVYDWSRFNGLPRAYDWIRGDIKSKRIKPTELVRATIRYGNMGTIRRIGALLEQMGIDDVLLKRLERKLARSTAKIPFVPGRPTRGEFLNRWGVVINE